MEVTKPYEFIGFGAMAVTKPYEFIGFGALCPERVERFQEAAYGDVIRADSQKWRRLRIPSPPAMLTTQDCAGGCSKHGPVAEGCEILSTKIRGSGGLERGPGVDRLPFLELWSAAPADREQLESHYPVHAQSQSLGSAWVGSRRV